MKRTMEKPERKLSPQVGTFSSLLLTHQAETQEAFCLLDVDNPITYTLFQSARARAHRKSKTDENAHQKENRKEAKWKQLA
jgi:hypothetical protein